MFYKTEMFYICSIQHGGHQAQVSTWRLAVWSEELKIPSI